MNLDSDAVKCILRRINPTKGFASWHIQWAVGNPKKLDDIKYSSGFALKMSDGNNYDSLLDGNLKVWNSGEALEIVLYRNGRQAKRMVGILRCGISTKNNGTVLFSNKHRFVSFDELDDDEPEHPRFYFPTENFKSSDDLIVHCWIDLPINDQWIGRKRRWNDEFYDVDEQARGYEKLSTDFSALFKGVCGSEDLFSSFSDVILQISDRKFYCHRNVLAARSSVFFRMFANKEWKESADGGERIVEIKDIEESTMEIVLQYIYLGNAPEMKNGSALEHFGKIIYAADKYNLQELKDWCMVQLILLEEKSDADIIDQFELAELYQLPILKTVCVASLSTDISFLKTEKTLPEELFQAVLDDSARRRFKTTEIVVRDS